MKISDREFPEIVSKLGKDICVSILTYSKHNEKLIRTLNKINEIDIYKIVSYNHIDIPPNPKIYDLAEIVVSTHPTLRNVNFPWFWHMKNCIVLMSELDFKYAFFICGDTLVGRPDRIFELPELLGDNDILSYAYSPRAIGTFCWFARISALLKIHKEMNKKWQGSATGAAGIKLRRIADPMGLKLKKFEEMDPKMFKVKRAKFKSYLTQYLELEHL